MRLAINNHKPKLRSSRQDMKSSRRAVYQESSLLKDYFFLGQLILEEKEILGQVIINM